jgi:hypothetical protein
MPTLAQLIAMSTRRPTATLYLDGRRCRGVLRITKSEAFGRGVSSATIELRDPPVTPTGGMAVRWTWGYDGVEVPGGTGYVVIPQKHSYPDVWTLECQDVLWLASREQGPIQTSPLNSITAKAAIEYILQTYGGNPRKQIPTINRPSGGGAWMLGQLTPVAWDKTTALAAAQEIAGTAGWWIYADAGGTVRAVQIERRPSDSPFRVLRRGDAADGGSLLVEGAPRRRQDWSQIKNRITVRGASTGVEGAQLVDTFLATHALSPGVVAEQEFSFFLLEYIADVTAVAQRLAGLWNRKPNTIEARIKADPRLAIGMTVAIQDDGIGYTAAVPFFVYALQTSIDLHVGRFDQQLTLDGGTGSAGYSLIPPPVAVITYTLEQETLADGTSITVVSVDGSGSYSRSAGEIVSYTWSTTDTPVSGTPTSATTPQAVFIFPNSAAPFDISLTVTDTSSKTDTATVAIPLTGDGITPAKEGVIAAAGSAASATPDGGATWRDEVRTVTIAAESAGVRDDAPATDATTYGALFASGSEVRRTKDQLLSASELLNTASGTITALHTNAKNGARQWRAVGTALQRSIDGGTTWAAWGTLPASVRQIIEDPAVENSVFVLAGATLYHSTAATAPGTSWATLYAGPSGAMARWMVRSDDGAITWIAYTGSFSGAALQRVEGGVAATFSGASPAVAEVRAIALTDGVEPAAPRLVAVDSTGRTWVGSATSGVLTQGPSLPAGGVAQHATASRIAPIIYLADFDSVTAGTTGALRKLVLGAGSGALLAWRLGPSGRQYHMVQLASPGASVKAYLLRPTWGASPGGVYVYDPDAATWTLKNTGLPSGWHWKGISVDPFNPNRWLLSGSPNAADLVTGSGGVFKAGASSSSPFWLTEDGGASWTALTVSAPSSDTINGNLYTPRWSESSGGLWYASGTRDGVGTPNVLIRGTTTDGAGTSLTGITLGTDGVLSLTWPGQGDEAILSFAQFSGGEYALRYTASSGSTTTRPSGTALAGVVTSLDREPSGRGVLLALSNGVILRTSDYRAAQPASTGMTGASSVAIAGSRAYVGTNDGLKEILDPWGSASLSSTRVGAGFVVSIRSARQGRAGVVRIGGTINASGSPNMIIADETTAREITGPAVLPASLSAAFDIFVQEGV